MARPPKERRVEQLPPITHYKPAGRPLRDIEEINLTVEEMEAIRLADIENLDHSRAAESMEISAPTFNRILNSAHNKIATALWKGYALQVVGGNFRVAECHNHGLRSFICNNCGHTWDVLHGTGQRGRDMTCPACQAQDICRKKR